MYDCVWLGAYRVTAYVCVRAVHNLCAASVCTNDVCVGVQVTSACVLVRELRELLLQKKAKEEAERKKEEEKKREREKKREKDRSPFERDEWGRW